MRVMRWMLVVALGVVAVASPRAQAGVTISSAFAREITVDGRADPAAETLVIYDTSYEAEARIGEGQIARDGTFAAVVQPALISNHRLVAVDKAGRRSPVFVVQPPRSGNVPSPPK